MLNAINNNSPHLTYLDSIRGICALYVSACHAYLMYASSALLASGNWQSRFFVSISYWLAFGRFAVSVFIVISGYSLMLSVVRSGKKTGRKNWFRFMYRRARRILPPYYGALVITIILILLVPGLNDPTIGEWHKSFPALTSGSILSHLSIIHNYFQEWQYSINHPMWSIATEWQIYFLFPGLVWISEHYGISKLIICTLVICLVLIMFLTFFSPEHNPWPPQFIILFGFGMAGAKYNYLQCRYDNRKDHWGLYSVLLFLLAVISSYFLQDRQHVTDLIVGGATTTALIFLTNELQLKSRSRILFALEWKPLVLLGHFSYSLYLIHAPILAIFFILGHKLGLGMTFIQFFILGVGLPFSVLASYFFYLVFERPFVPCRRC